MSRPRAAPRSTILASLLAACVAGPATEPSAAAPPTAVARRLRLCATPLETFRELVRVEVVVADDAGRELRAKASAVMSGTTTLLATLLQSSLAEQGCAATHAPGEPDARGERLWMHEVVVLPAGWRFVAATATGAGGAPSSQLELSLEAVD